MKKNYFKKPSKAAGKYKSTAAYFRAVYRANKTQIDAVYDKNVRNSGVIGGPKNAWEMFKRELLSEGEHMTTLSRSMAKEKIATLSRTQLYSRDEQKKENLKEALGKDKFAQDIIRRRVGWNKKLDWDNVKYHGDKVDKDNRYYYFEDDDGNRIAFKLGDNYKNKKKVTLVDLDENNDVADTYSALDTWRAA